MDASTCPTSDQVPQCSAMGTAISTSTLYESDKENCDRIRTPLPLCSILHLIHPYLDLGDLQRWRLLSSGHRNAIERCTEVAQFRLQFTLDALNDQTGHLPPFRALARVVVNNENGPVSLTDDTFRNCDIRDMTIFNRMTTFLDLDRKNSSMDRDDLNLSKARIMHLNISEGCYHAITPSCATESILLDNVYLADKVKLNHCSKLRWLNLKCQTDNVFHKIQGSDSMWDFDEFEGHEAAIMVNYKGATIRRSLYLSTLPSLERVDLIGTYHQVRFPMTVQHVSFQRCTLTEYSTLGNFMAFSQLESLCIKRCCYSTSLEIPPLGLDLSNCVHLNYLFIRDSYVYEFLKLPPDRSLNDEDESKKEFDIQRLLLKSRVSGSTKGIRGLVSTVVMGDGLYVYGYNYWEEDSFDALGESDFWEFSD